MPERTPEQIGREAGQAIADTIADSLEAVLLKMADAIAKVQAEQAELRDELYALRTEHDALVRLVQGHGQALGRTLTSRGD